VRLLRWCQAWMALALATYLAGMESRPR